MPSRMYDFVCYWRARGYSKRAGYRIWQWCRARLLAGERARITDGVLRWAVAS